MIYEVALRDGWDARHLYFDATAAFDSVPHVSFDVSFDRLGAPEDFIGSHRGIIGGDTRVAVTARDVDEESLKQRSRKEARCKAAAAPQSRG